MRKTILLIIIILLCIFTSISLAHSGRTDSSGGHYDYSTGKYHYHHGYSAHQHINGICPFESAFENLEPSNITSSSVDSSETLSDNARRVQFLENQIEKNDTLINNLRETISKNQLEIEKLKREHHSSMFKLYIFFTVIFFILIAIIYKIGISDKSNNNSIITKQRRKK